MSDRLDLFEIILKDDLKIPLNFEEKNMIESIDNDVKMQLYELVNNCSFLDEIENTTENIIRKSFNLVEEEQKYIRKKCQERIQTLKNPSLFIGNTKVKST